MTSCKPVAGGCGESSRDAHLNFNFLQDSDDVVNSTTDHHENKEGAHDESDGEENTILVSTLRRSFLHPLPPGSTTKLHLSVETDDEDAPPLLMPMRISERSHAPHASGSTAHSLTVHPPERYRCTSFNCFALSGNDIPSSAMTPLRSCKRDGHLYDVAVVDTSGAEQKEGVAAASTEMMPPNTSSVPCEAVFQSSCIVRSTCVPPATHDASYVVQIHTYDLSHKMLKKYSKQLVGFQSPGVYHSGVVCYGLEFYFEGNIGIAAAGRSRFGKEFKTITLGTTTKTYSEFMAWIKSRESVVYQLHDYHPVRHNCHHFSNDACEFLLDKENAVPSILFTTVKDLVKCELGGAVLEGLLLTSFGVQAVMARMLRSHVLERQYAMDRLVSAAAVCGVQTLPPTFVSVFRVTDHAVCAETLLSIEPYMQRLVEEGCAKAKSVQLVHQFCTELCAGYDTLTPGAVTAYMDIAAEALLRYPLSQWGPLLNSLRLAVLHKMSLPVCTFHSHILQIILLGARDFPRLLPDGRLALLRFACNLSSSHHGAIAHADNRFQSMWVSLAGMGLMDCNSAIVYTAACLALNLTMSITVATLPSLQRDMSQNSERHPLMRLATIVLYNLRHRSSAQLPEPAFNMLLSALLRMMSCNTVALDCICNHCMKPRFYDLLNRAETNESRALICIMKTMEDLFL